MRAWIIILAYLILAALPFGSRGEELGNRITQDVSAPSDSLSTKETCLDGTVDSVAVLSVPVPVTDQDYFNLAMELQSAEQYSESRKWIAALNDSFPQSRLIKKSRKLLKEVLEEQASQLLELASQYTEKKEFMSCYRFLDQIDNEFAGTKAASQTKALRQKNFDAFTVFIEESDKQEKDLELLSWNWDMSYGYVTAQGQVRNLSGARQENIVAVVTFLTATGEYITHAEALIDYNPLIPGQTSPFKVMQSANPLMKKASIEFKHLTGEVIPTYQKGK